MNIIHAAQAAMHNKESVLNGNRCGCFFCFKIFDPIEIHNYTDEGKTVLCPYCDTDTILADDASNPMTEEFLKEVKTYWL